MIPFSSLPELLKLIIGVCVRPDDQSVRIWFGVNDHIIRIKNDIIVVTR